MPGTPRPDARARGVESCLTAQQTDLLADYVQHLTAERNLSPHTVRAYAGDLTSLFTHLTQVGETDVDAVDIRALRRWLSIQHAAHAERGVAEPGEREVLGVVAPDLLDLVEGPGKRERQRHAIERRPGDV